LPLGSRATIDSLKPFVARGESYEVIAAIDAHDHAALCEDLVDFVFEAVFSGPLDSDAGLSPSRLG